MKMKSRVFSYIFHSPQPQSSVCVYQSAMKVTLPKHTMYDGELVRYTNLLKIPDFRGVKMRDELPLKARNIECGILNFNSHLQKGSHWTCWYKNKTTSYYFDSFGQVPPAELLAYLNPFSIHRSAVIVQHDNAKECGSLCLYVLSMLTSGVEFPNILESLLQRYKLHPTPPLSIDV